MKKSSHAGASHDGLVRLLFAGGVAALLGLILVIAAGASPALPIAMVAVGAIATVVIWSGNPGDTLLYVVVATAPFAMAKSLLHPAGLYPPPLELRLSDVPFAALLLARLVVGALRPDPRPSSGWLVSLLVTLCAWTAVSAAMAEDRFAGMIGVMVQTKFIVQCGLVYSAIRTPRVLRGALIAAAVGLSANLVMVGAQMAAGSPLALPGVRASVGGQIFNAIEGMRTFRPSGFLLHPNPFAAYLVMCLPVPVLLTLVGRRRTGAAVWWASLVLSAGGVLALLLTLSRGGWISSAVALAFAAVFAVRRRVVPLGTLGTAAALAVCAMLVVVLVYPTVVYRITRKDQRSTESRWMLMEQAGMVIRTRPIAGIGPGNYERVAHRYAPASFARLGDEYRAEFRRWIVHNGYLLIWAERGLVGLCLHLAVLLTAVVGLTRARQCHDPVLHAVAIGLVAGIVGQLSFYVFDHFYQDVHPGCLWLLLGLTAATLRLQSVQRVATPVIVRAAQVEPAFAPSAGVGRPAWQA